MKNILVVSHCILNTASKVSQDESKLAREYQLKNQLLSLVLENEIQLLQLPCPEFLLYGSRRWGHVKNQFHHPHYRKECKKMLEPILMQLEEYTAYPEEFCLLGIVSVEGSPSCGYYRTCIGQWKGELNRNPEDIAKLQHTACASKEPGVMMEVLQEELKHYSLDIPIMSMEEAIDRICV